MLTAGVITFPGSNCDRDMSVTLEKHFSKVIKIWHKDSFLPEKLDFLAIPGGFSYGDYLRSGAMAAHSNILKEVKKFAKKGGYILGICNGFQILTESKLLPGILLRNKNLKFIAKSEILITKNNNSIFTKSLKPKEEINIPIAHHDGNYFCDATTLEILKENEQIAFTYKNNPNGSINNIAGILSKNKRILGMMPHPERAADKNLVGGFDGAKIFDSIFNTNIHL